MEWKEVTLGEISSKIGDGLHGTPKYDDEGPYYFINGNNLNCGKIIIKDDTKRVGEDEFVKNQKELNEQTILVSINGTIGNVAKYNNELCILGKSACYINVIKEVDKEFIYYVLTSANFKRNITNEATGTTIKNVSLKQMREYKFNIPCNISDQRCIASILSSLDRKIELNNKINADLEEMAQTIFKNWFVDFEPFKDGKFVDSELGMIPEGWKVGTIGDIVEFQNGFTFSSKDFSENGEYKIITIKSVQDGCLVTEGSSKVTEYPTKMPAYCKLQSGDILLSLTGNVGRCCLVTETNLLLNQRVAKIKAKECYDNSFSYALFRLKETKELLISISRGTAQANLSPVEASKLPMVIPSEDARKSFSMITDSIMNKIISIHIENSRLSLLRDTLLPRLMSGEIEVPE